VDKKLYVSKTTWILNYYFSLKFIKIS
jgi:hypothetical protein